MRDFSSLKSTKDPGQISFRFCDVHRSLPPAAVDAVREG